MKLLKAIGLLLLSELVLVPVYAFVFVGIAFNDSGYVTASFTDFFGLIVPVYAYVILSGVAVLILRKYATMRRAILGVYFILHLILATYATFLYMDVYMTDSVNADYNIIVEQVEQQSDTNTQPSEDDTVVFTYDVHYQDGVITRSGSIGESVSWNITENDAVLLRRSARKNVTLNLSDLDNLFQKGHTYSVYLTKYVASENGYQKVSERVTFTY